MSILNIDLSDLFRKKAGSFGKKDKNSVAKITLSADKILSSDESDDKKSKPNFGEVCQWSTDGKIFTPSKTTVSELSPGAYEIGSNPSIGLYFQKYDVKTEALLKFPDTTSDMVIGEIEQFWQTDTKAKFKQFSLPYKRGILLWGPPGGGKSSTVQFIMKEVIGLNGVVINFTNPDLFIMGMRTMRQIQAETPVVVIMEDIDAILETYNESSVLNILDGADKIENTVFLGTTNYPENLSERIVNRPSRFDKRFLIKTPNATIRKFYLDHLFEKIEPKIDLSAWVEDTEGLSIAHLKELFVAVMILGNPYDEAIKTLLDMQEEISSDREDENCKLGFGSLLSTRDSQGIKKKIGFNGHKAPAFMEPPTEIIVLDPTRKP